MSRDQLQRVRRSLLDRLSQPSAAGGFAALLALLVPELTPHAPTLVELGLGAVAVAAAIVAMVRREKNGNGHDRGCSPSCSTSWPPASPSGWSSAATSRLRHGAGRSPGRAICRRHPVHQWHIGLTWVRRTRIGGELRDGTGAVPLAEDSGASELDFPIQWCRRAHPHDERSILYYTVAGRAAGFPVTKVRVCQVSAQVGRGFVAELTVENAPVYATAGEIIAAGQRGRAADGAAICRAGRR